MRLVPRVLIALLALGSPVVASAISAPPDASGAQWKREDIIVFRKQFLAADRSFTPEARATAEARLSRRWPTTDIRSVCRHGWVGISAGRLWQSSEPNRPRVICKIRTAKFRTLKPCQLPSIPSAKSSTLSGWMPGILIYSVHASCQSKTGPSGTFVRHCAPSPEVRQACGT